MQGFEFLFKIGAVKLVSRIFKTNNNACFRIHKDDENLMQVIYQIISAYFEDNCADKLTNKPIMTAILNKDTLASQPTLSRFYNRMDADSLGQLNQIIRALRKIVYSIKKPEFMLFDIDSTLLNTYGKQEGEGFNYHYHAHGYHPLLCYDELTGDLLKAELREGTMYCSKDADLFYGNTFFRNSQATFWIYRFISARTVASHHQTYMKSLKRKTANMPSD